MEIYDNYDINIDNGLYFGNKNLYTENQNIFIAVFQIARKKILNGRLKKYNEKIRSALISCQIKNLNLSYKH